MFNILTDELIGKIYEYDPTYKDIFNNVLLEFKEDPHILEYKIILKIRDLNITLKLYCMREDIIMEIKQQIENMFIMSNIKQPNRIIATHDNNVLNDNETLGEQHIKNNSIIIIDTTN
jgi:hypothetical protein